MASAGGIEFTLDILAKIDQAVKASKELDDVMKSAKKADDSIRKTEKDTGLLGRAFKSAGEMARGFASHLAALAVWDGIKRGVGMVAELGVSMFDAAADAQRMERAFSAMFGRERGGRLIAGADDLSKLTEFSDDVIKQASQQLLAAGIKDDRVIDSMLAAADIAAKTGTKEAGFWAAIDKFKMAQTTGKAPARLADMGLGEGAVKAIEREIAAGRSSVDALLVVLQKSNDGKAIGALAEERAKDADVRLQKIKDLPGQFFQQLSKSDAFEKLTAKMGSVLEAFDPDSPLGKRIFAGLERMVNRLGALFDKIDIEKVANTLILAFDKLPGLIEQSTRALLGFAKIMGAITGITGTAAPKAVSAGPGRATLMTPAAKASQVDLQVIPGTSQMVDRNTAFVGTAKMLDMDKVDPSVRNLANAKGFWAKAKALFGMGGNEAGKAAVEGAKAPDALDAHSPSRAFERLGRYSGDGFALGLQASMSDVMPDFAAQARPLVASAATAAVGARIEAHIVVNIGAGEKDPEKIAIAAEMGVRQALQSALEQMQTESG